MLACKTALLELERSSDWRVLLSEYGKEGDDMFDLGGQMHLFVGLIMAHFL
jgi:hypothetical protein